LPTSHPGGDLGSRTEAKFGEHVRDMSLHGRRSDFECNRDLSIREAGDEEGRHFSLAHAQRRRLADLGDWHRSRGSYRVSVARVRFALHSVKRRLRRWSVGCRRREPRVRPRDETTDHFRYEPLASSAFRRAPRREVNRQSSRLTPLELHLSRVDTGAHTETKARRVVRRRWRWSGRSGSIREQLRSWLPISFVSRAGSRRSCRASLDSHGRV
jgi:hypothetical protein